MEAIRFPTPSRAGRGNPSGAVISSFLCIWHYDRGCQQSDPLPGGPIVAGSWESIRSGHELVYFGGDRILDWVPQTGSYRIWHYDRGAQGNVDPLPTELAAGNWDSIREGHRLIHLEGDRKLDWAPRTGGYRIWGAYGT